MTEKIWAIHIPGPDDIYAAPSEAAAHHMAGTHNTSMTEYIEKNPGTIAPPFGFWRDLVMATVTEWPGTPESHAEGLKDFDYAGWGLIKP